MKRASSLFLLLALGACSWPKSEEMGLGEQINQLPAYNSFCERYPTECRIPLTPSVQHKIETANIAINELIKPEWDEGDHWDLAEDGAGDCEDYALRKRQALTGLYPDYAQAFRLALVTHPSGQGHMVLTVHTDQGVYVLDNLTPHVLPWKHTEYTWHYMHVPFSPNWKNITE